ncbi:MAG: rRNA maturation RNase YbeY [Candidatus Limnocylindrales bacterium]
MTNPGPSIRYLPPWRIELSVRPGVPRLVPLAQIARLVDAALRAVPAPAPASVAVILADDDELASLNAKVMGKKGPTDVLSFPLLPPEAFPTHDGKAGTGAPAHRVPAFALPPGVRPHLGDVVVSVERAVEQAVKGGGGQTGTIKWAPGDEIALLVVHGVLHLCGWDHAEANEEAAMRRLEMSILASRPRRG